MVYPWHKSEFVSLLKRRNQLPHALLLRGPCGIGKLAYAEALAHALLCENPAPDGSACAQCTACGWMGQGSHPDFRRLEPEVLAGQKEADQQGGEKKEKAGTQIPVEQVRGIADFINISSHRGGVKLVLIHPAESLNASAANALLKNLEEPPPRTCFLLVAHRWHQLLPTIKSRCQQIVLNPPSADEACGWLRQQGAGYPELALAQAGGAPLLAVGFDEEYWQQRAWFLQAISSKGLDALAVAGELRDHAPAVVVNWMQKWSYDLVCHKVTGKVRYNPDFATPISVAADRIELLEAVRFLRRVVRLQRIVLHPLNTRLFFEELLLIYAALLRDRPLGKAA
ncbi:MAG TPA: DNA polymerase III subunit delta' [Burkholderiales bacterium]|nr:DNA polymerase III subunit delta' [Burkholderiales bacterium]